MIKHGIIINEVKSIRRGEIKYELNFILQNLNYQIISVYFN